MDPGDPRPPGAAGLEPQPVFWKEMYWFLLIGLGGWMLAMWLLPPRLSRERLALDLEAELRRTNGELARSEQEYEAAIAALESDPFFREEVYRTILKVKRKGEDFLKADPEVSDN